MILTRGYKLEPMTNVLLFTAARVELWRKIAEPVLKRNGIVVSARNFWSTIAYQGYGEGISRSKIIRLTHDALPDRYCHPDKGFILTVPDKIRLERQGVRGKATETFEAKPDAFQQKVNAAYPKIAKEFNIPIIDASGTIEEVFEKIINSLRLS
jgi:dTMP kinase